MDHLAPHSGTVIDIGGSRVPIFLKNMLDEKFLMNAGRNQCLLPSAMLHDDTGLRIWRKLNRLPDYYQTRDEIDLLKRNGGDLARFLAETRTLVDLGCGYDE
jgi:hypothetical protein